MTSDDRRPRGLRLISSMATRHLLGALTAAWAARGGPSTHIESVGGVDAARRVREGDAFDVVVLAADAMAGLDAAGRLRPGSLRALADSPIAIAVQAGAAQPDIGSEAALREAVLKARSIGYSTGPSGTALMRLFERWRIMDLVEDRLVQARPGVPVGSLVASGEAALGFQQLSELMTLSGITLLGGLPPGLGLQSRFSGAVGIDSPVADEAQRLLDFMAGSDAADLKSAHGMQPVIA